MSQKRATPDLGKVLKSFDDELEFRLAAEIPAVDQTLKVSEAWQITDYRCCSCGDHARLHPQTNHIWGCLSCGFTTAAVSIYFEPIW